MGGTGLLGPCFGRRTGRLYRLERLRVNSSAGRPRAWEPVALSADDCGTHAGTCSRAQAASSPLCGRSAMPGGKGPGGGSWSILPVSQRRSTGSHRLASGGASIGRLHSATCHKGCQFRGQPQPPSWKDEEGQEKGPKEGPATRWCLGPGPNPPSLPVSPWGGLGEGHLESFQMKGSRWPHTHPPRSPWPERFQMLTPAQAPRPQL